MEQTPFYKEYDPSDANLPYQTKEPALSDDSSAFRSDAEESTKAAYENNSTEGDSWSGPSPARRLAYEADSSKEGPWPYSSPDILREKQDQLLLPVFSSFPFFAGLSLMFGFLFTFCLYKNPCGITYPLFTAFACFCGIFACRRLQIPMKKGSWFLLAAALLIGITTCRTADPILILLNGIALVLLGCIFALHQFYDDTCWNIGKYLVSMICYLFQALAAVAIPFRHTNHYLKQQDNRVIKQLPVLLAGFLAAIPVLVILIALLGAADVIFSDLMNRLFWNILRPATLLGLLFRFVFGTLALYCLICSCCLHGISQDNADHRSGNPLMVASGLFMITAVYVIFCGIQVIYLFLGKGTLPEAYTYSSYARQGFFQLLAVAFLNLVMVLCCLKYIRPHKAIRLLLTVICCCTYIMIASACWRMILYVREYHLTYLRILVLWFLAMLTLLMAGVTCMVWKQKFPLFRYALAVVSVFYIALAWARPDSVIAWDYVNHLEHALVSQADLSYLTTALSADAAPALAVLEERCEADGTAGDLRWGWKEIYYEEHCGSPYQTLGLRNYNFSLAEAKRLFPERQ